MKILKNRYFKFIIVVIVIELFVLNFRSFESLGYKTVTPENVSISSGDTLSEDNVITFSSSGDHYIEITNINQVISNLYLDITNMEDSTSDTEIRLSASDDGSAPYYNLPKYTIKGNKPSSQYIKLNLNGEAKSLKISFTNSNEQSYFLKSLSFDTRRPFDVSLLRMLLMFLGLCAIYVIRPSSEIYQIKWNFRHVKQQLFIVLLAGLQILLVASLTLSDPNDVKPPWTHHYQYARLAEAFSKGQLYLDREPTPELMAMENPYDRNLRRSEGVSFGWDHAYYEGKYYVYFGVLPVLTFYLPYYQLTGNAFPTWLGLVITAIVLIIGLLYFLNSLVKRYFKNTSFGLFVLMDLFMFVGSGLLITAINATFYQLPIMMGVTLTIWGLAFWIKGSVCKNSKKTTVYLTAGSLCMALVAACRPQLLVGSFLCIPLLWSLFKNKLKDKKSRKKGIQQLIGFALPYVIVAALLMWYNYARFGSPFDFGANYNLTTNDMTSRGFHLDRLPLGTYMYLFQPLCFETNFPFIRNVTTNIMYQGQTIIESMYGGILWLNPILFSLAFIPKVKTSLKEKKLFSITIVSIVSAGIIVFANTQMAGILFRYLCDYGIFLMIPAILVILALMEQTKDEEKRKFRLTCLSVCAVLTGILWFLLTLTLTK